MKVFREFHWTYVVVILFVFGFVIVSCDGGDDGPTEPADEGLVAYYPFNGNANDESGNGNHGSVFGATLASDRFGNPNNAYDFNGITAYITTPLDINISTMPELTMSVWVSPRRTGPEDEEVVHRGRRQILSSDDGDFDRSLLVRYGYWEIFMGGRNWNTRVLVDINTWQHIVVVFEISDVKFYKNGNMYSYGLFSGTGSSIYPLTIGNNPSPGWNESFDGIIDDVRIYNRALSSSEIQKLYNEGT